jgi:competence protein ComEC
VAALQASFLLRVPGNPLAALALSALAVVLFDPLQLFSASFQMSYGIVAALLLLGLPLADAWLERSNLFASLPEVTWRWHHYGWRWLWRQTVTAMSIGVAATLVGTLSGILFFQIFTPGGLLANLLLIPAAFLVIMAGFLSLLFGLMGATFLSVLFNHAAVAALAAIDALVRGFVRLPAMWFEARFTAPELGALALTILMAALFYGYAQAWKPTRGGWWPPFVVVALALILSVKFG